MHKSTVLAELQPTQLYLSINAPDEEMYRRVCRPPQTSGQDPESLEIIRQHRCRSVIRLTLARGSEQGTAGGLRPPHREGEPDYVEVKAYMHLGRSEPSDPRGQCRSTPRSLNSLAL